MPGAAARELRRLGMDVQTTVEAGLIGASDRQQLAHAHAGGRVLATQDGDFAHLHAQGESHSGIAYFPRGPRPIGEIIEMLTLLYEAFSAEEMVGRIE